MTINNEFLTSLQHEGRIDNVQKKENEPEEKPTPAPSADNENNEEKSPTSQGEQKPEEKGTDEPVSKEGKDNTEDETKLPFHKHPRWITLQNELKEAREFREQVTPLLERLGTKPDERKEETIEIPEWFVELFGDNAEAWGKYRAYDTDQRKKLRSEILSELQSKQQQVVDEQKKHEKWVDEQVQQLMGEGLKFDRNELLKTAIDYLPTDQEGNIDFRKAYDILQMKKAGKEPEKKPTVEKKIAADKTMGQGKTEEGKKDYKTSADLKGKSFRDLVSESE